ncbi:MAG: tetratricopeptide repeat protein [Desulfurivibrionaceae bacterium]
MEPSLPGPVVPETIELYSGSGDPEWLSIWKNARSTAANGDLAGAVREYHRLINRKPNINEISWELARIRVAQGEFELAVDLLEDLPAKYQQRPEVLIVKAQAREEMGHRGRAVKLYKRALEVEEGSRHALSGLVRCLLAEEDNKNALPYLEELYEQNKGDREVAEILAELYFDQGSYEKVLSVLAPLVKKDQVSSKELRLAAKSEAFLDSREEAFNYWKKLVDLVEQDREAHRWLAGYYEEKKNWQATLTHLHALRDLTPEDRKISLRIARCYIRLDKFEKGLKYVSRFLDHRPYNKEALRLLVNINASLGREEKTLEALDRYFAAEPKPSPEKLKQAARLYDARGRYEEAIPLYKKLIKNNPNDTKLLRNLADDLLAIGEDEGALHILNQLAAISPDREVYQAMADLLEKLGRREELILVLERLHVKDPSDPETVLKLIALYLEKNERERANVLYTEIADRPLASPDLLRMRGNAALAFGLQEHALQDYSRFLEIRYDREICYTCISIAGRLGLVSDLKRYTVLYLDKSVGLEAADQQSVEEYLLKDEVFRKVGATVYLGLARSWRNAFLLETAGTMYEFITEKPGASGKIRFQAYCGLAELYRQEGRIYKTEEAYRMAMAVSGEKYQVMGRLVETYIELGNFERAETWLSLMDFVDERKVSNDVFRRFPDYKPLSRPGSAQLPYFAGQEVTGQWYSSFLGVRLSIARGSFRDAVARGEAMAEKMLRTNGGESLQEVKERENPDLQPLYSLKELLVVAHANLDNFEKAEQLIDELAKAGRPSLLLNILKLIIIQDQAGDNEEIFNSLLAEAEKDLGLMENLHDILLSLGEGGADFLQGDFIDRVRSTILDRNPDNFKVAVLLCRSLKAKGEYQKALELCRECLKRFPDSSTMQAFAASLYYRLNKEEQALSYCNKVLAGADRRPGILLLKARIIWRSDREESLSIIKSYLRDSAEDLVSAAFARAEISLPPRPEKSFWEKYKDKIIRKEENRTYLDTVMKPDFLIGSEREGIFDAAFQYYARYRWQRLFREEASAREAVMRGEYFRAAHHFNNLLAYRESTDISVLFDLGQVYGKLGKFEDEAFLYQRVKESDPDFPGLARQVRRNKLQMRPRFALNYRYLREEGWNGYKAMKQTAGGVSSRFSSSPRKHLRIAADYIRYSPTGGEGDPLSAKRLFMTSKGSFFDKANFKLGAGVEYLNYDSQRTGLFLCQIDRQFTDDFRASLSFERDVVADTYASLTRNVVADNSQASVAWDLSPFFSAGGDYGTVRYSDSNNLDAYSLWTKFHIFGKPSYLTFTYQYSFRDADESEVKSGETLPDGFQVDDHPYWAPQDYWENSFSLNWQQPISKLFMEHESPSYYSASFTLDYDERGRVRQTVKGGIYLELGRHFIGRSSVKYTTSENYDVREASLAAMYRW